LRIGAQLWRHETAEDVETDSQRDQVTAEGCTEMQGTSSAGRCPRTRSALLARVLPARVGQKPEFGLRRFVHSLCNLFKIRQEDDKRFKDANGTPGE